MMAVTATTTTRIMTAVPHSAQTADVAEMVAAHKDKDSSQQSKLWGLFLFSPISTLGRRK